jgi:hypothetical protein
MAHLIASFQDLDASHVNTPVAYLYQAYIIIHAHITNQISDKTLAICFKKLKIVSQEKIQEANAVQTLLSLASSL